jgi:hypothetical protein
MGFAKYIVNIDELFEKFNIDVDANLEDFKNYLENRLNEITTLLNQLLAKDKRVQSIKSMSQNIPAIMNDFILEHSFNAGVVLTGITYSQSAWKAEDSWSLMVDKRILFDHVCTKELGEYKHLNAFCYVPDGALIQVMHHNRSGNSKFVWVDIEYLKLNN